ncbi:MAG: pyridoxamine 5'-phosphate oxidase family protein [Anaerolineae bacterium]|nr:pyridoxamine 5'-phosphate oxidase family protein [Thermoflexales bacterium]MDW8407406.1 pyridoxamine 5'-phosphate oxidase family protein [Anaerolineae bacterium]
MIVDPFMSEVRAFLNRHNVLTLAYRDAHGVGACAVWFAVDDRLHLYFLSAPHSRHGQALAEGGQVAFTVQKDEQDWQTIQGVQGIGLCAMLRAGELDSAWQVYTRRFPFVTHQIPDLNHALGTAALWRIIPTWLRLIDNRKGFGHKQERWLLDSVSD